MMSSACLLKSPARMNDKELADKVVALGVGYRSGPHAYGIFLAEGTSERIGGPEDFVRDWRVAGALMEKMTMEGPDKLRTVMGSYHPTLGSFEASVSTSATNPYGTYLDRSNESLPRAIIEACVGALEPVQTGQTP